MANNVENFAFDISELISNYIHPFNNETDIDYLEQDFKADSQKK